MRNEAGLSVELEKLADEIAQKVYQKLLLSMPLQSIPGQPPVPEYQCGSAGFTCGGKKDYSCENKIHGCAGPFACIADEGFNY